MNMCCPRSDVWIFPRVWVHFLADWFRHSAPALSARASRVVQVGTRNAFMSQPFQELILWQRPGKRLDLNARLIFPPFLLRWSLAIFSFSLWIPNAYALRPSSPIFFPWSTTPPPIECKGAIFPNDRRHRFSSQTFLWQLRREKNRYCGRTG